MHALRDLPIGSEALVGLIGDLYEGPLELSPWQSFAERLREAFAARNVAFTLHHGEGVVFDTYVMAAETGDTTDWDEVESVYRERFMRNDPTRLELMQAGEILNIAVEDRTPSLNAYLASCNIGDGLRASFAEPGGMRCWLDIVRPLEPRAPFGAPEVALLRLLLPHLTRSLRLYAGQKRQEAEKALYEDTMDHFSLGSVLLDGELRIVRSNRAAEAIIAAHRGIRIEGARLRLADLAQRLALEAALGRALTATRQPPCREAGGELVRIGQPNGRLLALLVHPLTQARYYRGTHAPSVVVYLTDFASKLGALEPARVSSQALLAQLFGLTPQQARLALLLADGCSLATAAERMGVAESAARSYSKRMYAKMGIGSQSDIVRLVYRSFALMR